MGKLMHYSEDGPKRLSDVVLYEIHFDYSREVGEMAPTAEAIPLGAVLCQNASGQYEPFGAPSTAEETENSDAKSTGSETKEAGKADAKTTGAETGETGKTEANTEAALGNACAILISQKLQASEEAQPCVVLARGACVYAPNLVWGADVTDEQKKSALASLKALGIVPKE